MDSATGMEDIESSVVTTDFEDYSHIFSDINTIVIEVQPNDCINEVEVETEPNDDSLFLDMSSTEEEIQEVLINYEMSDPEDECKSIIHATLNASQPRVAEVNDSTYDEMEREYISFEDEEIVNTEDITDEQPTESGEEDPVEIEMRNIFEGEASSPQKSNRPNGIKAKDKLTSKAKKRPMKNSNLNKSKSTLCTAVQNLLKHKNNKSEPVAKVPLSSRKRNRPSKKKAISSEIMDQAKAYHLSRMHVHVQDKISPKATRSVKRMKNNVPSKLTSKHSQRIRVEVQKVALPKKIKQENENNQVSDQSCKPKIKSEYILPDYILPEDILPDAAAKTPPRSAHMKCVVCTFVCTSKRALIQHVKSHSEDKNSFECPTCKKVFSQQCNLKRHMRCHSGERPYTCQYCKKLFADQGYLTTHLRYHTNTKPYKCSVCGKTFFDRSNYIKHLKSHSGEKPYPCSLCGKSFLQQSDLTRHSRVHSGERPFKCTFCDRSFTQHGDLTTHLRHHTGERPFVCSNCKKTFANKRYLNSHVKGQICMKVVGGRGKGHLSAVVKVESDL